MGSGSACRSMYGGFVAWEMGSLADGTDSKAVQYEDENHWPELQILILVVNDQKKETSSTGGMETSVKTSQLLQVLLLGASIKRFIFFFLIRNG